MYLGKMAETLSYVTFALFLAIHVDCFQARRTARVPQIADLVVGAISHLSRYDVFKTPVIVQVVYSSRNKASILFIPSSDSSAENRGQRSNWRILASFPSGDVTKPKLTVRGVHKVSKADADKLALNKAVLVASRRLASEGLLQVPLVITATKTKQGYYIQYTWLPEVPGGFVAVELSEDLQKYHLMRGR